MAESMNIYFADATWDQVSAWFDEHFHSSVNCTWALPATDYFILVYEFTDCQNEMEPDEFDTLCDLLGN